MIVWAPPSRAPPGPPVLSVVSSPPPQLPFLMPVAFCCIFIWCFLGGGGVWGGRASIKPFAKNPVLLLGGGGMTRQRPPPPQCPLPPQPLITNTCPSTPCPPFYPDVPNFPLPPNVPQAPFVSPPNTVTPPPPLIASPGANPSTPALNKLLIPSPPPQPPVLPRDLVSSPPRGGVPWAVSPPVPSCHCLLCHPPCHVPMGTQGHGVQDRPWGHQGDIGGG